MVKHGIENRIAELQEGLKQIAIESGDIADPEEVMKGYTRDIRFNPKSLYNKKGRLIPIPKLDDEIALCVAGCKRDATGALEYKYPDKNRVRDSLAKTLGMIPKKR